jgi:hypothetical protein
MLDDPAKALLTEERICRFLDRHIIPLAKQGFSNAALDKTLAAIGGWALVGTRTRWPYQWVPAEVAAQLAPLARADIPELFPA